MSGWRGSGRRRRERSEAAAMGRALAWCFVVLVSAIIGGAIAAWNGWPP